jgi:glycosyltransferase involved in cell wall biosynthesis
VRATLSSGTLNDEYWQHYFGKDFPRFLLPYSVDNDFFEQRAAAAAPQQAALRKELGLEPNRPVILFASKLQKRKHCMDLVEAFLQMREDVQPQPYLLIIGDGEERAAIEARIAEAGDAGRKNIFMLGFRNLSELPRYFDLCRVFVLPARHEPWGLIVNEVMNAGRAVIVTDEVGAAPDLVENSVNGFVVPVRDVKALAKALLDVLSNPEMAVKMGAKSLERIRHWGFAENVAGMKAALDWLRSGHRSATP